MRPPLLAVDFVVGLVQNEYSFCTKNTGDVFLRKCYAFDYGKRPARPAEPVDTITVLQTALGLSGFDGVVDSLKRRTCVRRFDLRVRNQLA